MKFKVGDKVTVNGKPGVVVEVAAHDSNWLKGEEQLYSVKTEEFVPHLKTHHKGEVLETPEPVVKDGKPVGDYKVLGCVPESALKKA